MGYVIKICANCGAEYELWEASISHRDKDSYECEDCGHTYISWNGGVTYREERKIKAGQGSPKK